MLNRAYLITIGEGEQSVFARFYAGFPQPPPRRACIHAPSGGFQVRQQSRLQHNASSRAWARDAARPCDARPGAAIRSPVTIAVYRMNLTHATILFFAALVGGRHQLGCRRRQLLSAFLRCCSSASRRSTPTPATPSPCGRGRWPASAPIGPAAYTLAGKP